MFRSYLAREIGHWSSRGLLQPGQAEELLADHDRRHTGFSLSGVLAVLAAVLLGAAVVALVAANWEAIARPLRVAVIAGLIGAGLGIAAVALRRNARWIAEAALVFTLLVFGAGIALVGQMYHLSGDDAGFMLAWTIGALVVSLAFASGMAAISAGVLGLGFLLAESAIFMSGSIELLNLPGYMTVLAVALVTGLAAWRARSRLAGHVCAVLLLGWVMWIVDEATDLDPRHVLIVIGAAAFAAGSLTPSLPPGMMRRHGTLSAYGAVLFLSGLGLVQIDPGDVGLAAEMAFAAVILLASVGILVVAGGENRLIRRFAYVCFACETIYVVSETLGSLLGSAGFLFLGGLVLAVIAFAVMKIERRFKAGEGRS
ncbi:DUF2157 domain-containing protein [Hoeflea ulvae]|uniref:DUF2157 domain-containing protein n=1 Tax=Hoeflea ulvae TaxID=2983764 RepID=A0ABT3YH31_9HYPH|nr:DUF2157 domain-containing protein [Hoeflea ulvae]MCY0095200.1 DUF2157 domain-containing protein [Hoeflea ulvae]